MPAEQTQNHSWPHWHIDVKWLLGLLLLLFVSIQLLSVTLWKITDKPTAIQIGATVVASLFSPHGLDDPGDLDTLKRQAASTKGNIIEIPNLPVVIQKSDLETLSPRQLRLKIFGSIVEPIYRLGPKEAAKQVTTDPEQQKQFVNDAFYFQFFTQTTHDRIGELIKILGGIILVLLVPFVFFSHGWGRLGNPGFILTVSSLPGAAAFALMTIASMSPQGQNATAQEIIPLLVPIIRSTYFIPFLIGAVLLLVAGIGAIISHRRDRTVPIPKPDKK